MNRKAVDAFINQVPSLQSEVTAQAVSSGAESENSSSTGDTEPLVLSAEQRIDLVPAEKNTTTTPEPVGLFGLGKAMSRVKNTIGSEIPDESQTTANSEVVVQATPAPVEVSSVVKVESVAPEVVVDSLVASDPQVSESTPSVEVGGRQRSVAALVKSADHLIALTAERRKENGVSHKEAKEQSENYAHARSEITKIKNRLRKVAEGKETADTKSEILQLRKQLANHLWELKKDFPMRSSEEMVTRIGTELGRHAVVNSEGLHSRPEYEQLQRVRNRLKETDPSKKENEALGTQPSAVSLRKLRMKHAESLLQQLSENMPQPQSAALEAWNQAEQLAAKIEVLIDTSGYHDPAKKDLPYVPDLVKLNGLISDLLVRLKHYTSSEAAVNEQEVDAIAAEVADVANRLRRLQQDNKLVTPEKVQLLGLSVPAAGAGPFAVAAFRKALELEWQPVKQAALRNTEAAVQELAKDFQQLFAKLNSIPPSIPLSARDAAHLAILAERIKHPERISGTYVPPVPETIAGTSDPTLTKELVEKRGAPGQVAEKMNVLHQEKLRAVLPQYTEKETIDQRSRRRFAELGGAVLLAALVAPSDTQQVEQFPYGGDVSVNGVETTPIQPSMEQTAADTLPDGVSVAPDGTLYGTEQVVRSEPVWPTVTAVAGYLQQLRMRR